MLDTRTIELALPKGTTLDELDIAQWTRMDAEAWWEVYGRISQVCGELDMGIGLSTYTLDWPRGAPNLFYQLFYSKPELNALELAAGPRQRVRGGETTTRTCPAGLVAARAPGRFAGRLAGGVEAGQQTLSEGLDSGRA